MIEVTELCKRFGETRAVDDISFHIRKGEIVGLLGPNGAGKTTTMRLLTHYLAADSGRIHLAGIDVAGNPIAARRKVGYLPENAPLYNDLSVYEVLKYVAAIRRVPRVERRARIKEMVRVCGLDEVLAKSVGVLSKGYRQRVGLAQTLIHDPPILILDEPTTGLDPNQIVEIRELIKGVGKEKTIIISTHILSEVQAACSRVIIINKGKIIADGTTRDLAEKLEAKETFLVKVRGEKGLVEAALGEAMFVTSFESRWSEEGTHQYRIEGPGDLGEALFRLAAAKGFVLLEIQKETVSLEEIFTRLTQEGGGT
jgi:ABC-2 type transport system ATP-binding protein